MKSALKVHFWTCEAQNRTGNLSVFQGASSLSLDAKGRLSVPTRHRDVLAATASGQLTITKHPHGCLMIFPRPEWEKFRDRIAALPISAQWWKRIFLGNAMDVELDGTGRVLVSLPAACSAELLELTSKAHVPVRRLGVTGGDALAVDDQFTLSLDEIRTTWQAPIPAAMAAAGH